MDLLPLLDSHQRLASPRDHRRDARHRRHRAAGLTVEVFRRSYIVSAFSTGELFATRRRFLTLFTLLVRHHHGPSSREVGGSRSSARFYTRCWARVLTPTAHDQTSSEQRRMGKEKKRASVRATASTHRPVPGDDAQRRRSRVRASFIPPVPRPLQVEHPPRIDRKNRSAARFQHSYSCDGSPASEPRTRPRPWR